MRDFLFKIKRFFMKGHVTICLKSLATNIYNISFCFGMIGVLLAWIFLEIVCLFLAVIIELIAFPFRFYENYLKKISVSKDLGKVNG